MAPRQPFPDAELVALALFRPLAHTVTVTPPDMSGEVIRINRVGGTDDGFTDYPRLEVVCYSARRSDDPQSGRARAWQIAEACRSTATAAVNTTIAGTLLDAVDTISPPAQIPNANDAVASVVLQLEFAWRRPRKPAAAQVSTPH